MDYVTYIRQLVGSHKIIMNASAVILTDAENRILLQHRGDDHFWGLPGGIMELGETCEETAIRETLEETGLHIELIQAMGPFHNVNKRWPNGDKAHIICFVYVAKVIGGSLTIDGDETLDLTYFGKDQLPPIDAIDHLQAIKQFYGIS